MKAVLFIIACVLVAVTCAGLTQNQKQFLFTRYVQQYNKSYEMKDVFQRFAVFSENLEKIIAHNAESNSDVVLSINQFGDLSNEEYKKVLGLKMIKSVSNHNSGSAAVPPCMRTLAGESKDWTTEGVVAPIKDQGQCGSCWAFSANSPIETAIAIQSKSSPVELSEQFLVDCCNDVDCASSEGCNGGFMPAVYNWYKSNKNGNPALAMGYKYTGRDGSCNRNTPRSSYNVFDYKVMKSNNDMDTAIEQGTISIGIDAGGFAFQFYSSGVISGKSSCRSSELNHGVVIVGYGVDAKGTNFWKIRNSWGGSWGEKGYLKVERHVNCLNVETYSGSEEDLPNSIPFVTNFN
jgi:KDEL-tailed cysteine endopeptidase